MAETVNLPVDRVSLVNQERYNFCETRNINILMVGRSGAGKTTTMNGLLNPKNLIVSTTGYSDTKYPTCKPYCLYDEEKGTVYNVNMLDTPGLQEHRRNPEENRTDDELFNLAVRCLENNVVMLNVVCFVSQAGATYEHDVAAFEKVKSVLGPEYRSNTMMVLTHCEQIPESRVEKYIQEIKEHPVTKSLYEYCQLGVFPFGAVNEDNVAELDEVTKNIVIQARLKKVANMRNALISKFIQCTNMPQTVKQLEILREETEKKRQEVIREHVKNSKYTCSVM